MFDEENEDDLYSLADEWLEELIQEGLIDGEDDDKDVGIEDEINI